MSASSSGQRNLTVELVRKLSARFKLPADVFIPNRAAGARAWNWSNKLVRISGDALRNSEFPQNQAIAKILSIAENYQNPANLMKPFQI
jgi:hypothetical protein